MFLIYLFHKIFHKILNNVTKNKLTNSAISITIYLMYKITMYKITSN